MEVVREHRCLSNTVAHIYCFGSKQCGHLVFKYLAIRCNQWPCSLVRMPGGFNCCENCTCWLGWRMKGYWQHWCSLKCAAFVCFTPLGAFSGLSITRIFLVCLDRIEMRSGVCCAMSCTNRRGQTSYPSGSHWDGVNFLCNILYGTVLHICG